MFLVHGFKWSPAQYKEDFTLSYLIENKSNFFFFFFEFSILMLFLSSPPEQLSSAGKATLAAALLLHADTLSSSETPLVKELLQDLINQIRVQGRTAFVLIFFICFIFFDKIAFYFFTSVILRIQVVRNMPINTRRRAVCSHWSPRPTTKRHVSKHPIN